MVNYLGTQGRLAGSSERVKWSTSKILGGQRKCGKISICFPAGTMPFLAFAFYSRSYLTSYVSISDLKKCEFSNSK